MKERSVPIRPGIEEHLVRGAMSLCEFGIYTLIHIQADYRTGIWQGSATRIIGTASRGATLRKVQRALERFEEMGYLKSFRVQGQRGNTPYLIDKFTVRSGALKGQRLNAAKSESWRHPAYELVAESDADTDTHTDTATGSHSDALSRSKKLRSKKEEIKPSGECVPLPVADGFERFYAAYPRKKGKAEAERAWRKVKPEEAEMVLARLEIFKLGEWQGKDQQYIPYPATWLNGRRWEDEIEKEGTNGARRNGSPAATELAIRNAVALGLEDRPAN